MRAAVLALQLWQTSLPPMRATIFTLMDVVVAGAAKSAGTHPDSITIMHVWGKGSSRIRSGIYIKRPHQTIQTAPPGSATPNLPLLQPTRDRRLSMDDRERAEPNLTPLASYIAVPDETTSEARTQILSSCSDILVPETPFSPRQKRTRLCHATTARRFPRFNPNVSRRAHDPGPGLTEHQ